MGEPAPTPSATSPAEPLSEPGLAEPGSTGRGRFDLRGESLRGRTARGTLINTAFLAGLTSLALVKAFVLAALLTTSDYGLWGITAVAVSLVVTLRQVGVADKFVQQDEPDQELAFQRAFTFELIVSGTSALLLAAALPLLVILYDEPRMLVPGLLLALNLVIGAFHMPLWVYYRRMQFMRQRLLESVDPLVAFVVSVALALAGAGYWALFGGVTAGIVAAAVVAVAASPYRLRLRFDGSAARSYLSFSAPLLVAGLGGPLIAQVALLATDTHLGVAAAGALTLAATISQFTDRIDHLVTGSIYPAICAVKDRTQLLYESFVKTNRLALMCAVPFGLGLSLFAADLIDVIGGRWEPALPLLQVFGITAAVGHVGFNWDAYFRARGETKPIAAAAAAAAVSFFAVGLPLLFAYGLKGLAAGIAVQTLVHVCCRAFFLKRLFDGFGFLSHALRAFLPVLPGVGLVLIARGFENGDRGPGAVAGELFAFVSVCAVTTLVLERDLLREAGGYLRRRPTAGAAT